MSERLNANEITFSYYEGDTKAEEYFKYVTEHVFKNEDLRHF